MTTINELRLKINKIDESIIKKLAQRKQCVITIGKLKSQQKINIYDNKREKELMKLYDGLSEKYGLEPEFVRKLFEEIIANSRKMQKTGRK